MAERLQTVLREEDVLVELTKPIADTLRRRLSPNVVAFPPHVDASPNKVADDFEDAAATLQILASSLLADVEGALLEFADQLADRAARARDEDRTS